MIWLTFSLFVVVAVLSVVSNYLQNKAIRTMTVEKFCKRALELEKKKDYKALSSFFRLHLGFMVLHASEINAQLSSEGVDVQNLKKEDDKQ